MGYEVLIGEVGVCYPGIPDLGQLNIEIQIALKSEKESHIHNP